MKQYKPRDKITQKMTRDGAIAENQTTGEAERITKRTQDADFGKSPEQQAQQDGAQLQGAASPTSPLPHAPGAAIKPDTATAERVMEHLDGAKTRKASKKAVRKRTGGSHRADNIFPLAVYRGRIVCPGTGTLH